jgi:uncharacterized protein (TIGR03083 family)
MDQCAKSTWNTVAMTNLLPDAVVVEAYRDLRRRMIELLRETPPHLGASPVPHCPAWSVRDVAAHLVGVPEDILAGRMEGVTTEAWTQAQVDRHLDQSLADLADIWASQIESFDAVLPHIPAPVNSQMVMDAVTHEHDIRHALGKAGARDSSAVRVGLGWLLDAAGDDSGLATRLRGSGLDDFDLLRVMSGRRSAEQIARLGLDANDILPLFVGKPLTPPSITIDE